MPPTTRTLNPVTIVRMTPALARHVRRRAPGPRRRIVDLARRGPRSAGATARDEHTAVAEQRPRVIHAPGRHRRRRRKGSRRRIVNLRARAHCAPAQPPVTGTCPLPSSVAVDSCAPRSCSPSRSRVSSTAGYDSPSSFQLGDELLSSSGIHGQSVPRRRQFRSTSQSCTSSFASTRSPFAPTRYGSLAQLQFPVASTNSSVLSTSRSPATSSDSAIEWRHAALSPVAAPASR